MIQNKKIQNRMTYFGEVNMIFFPFIAKVCMIFILCMLVSVNSVYGYDDVVVVIDAGHGGDGEEKSSNLGAINDEINEKDINLITAKALYDELSEYGNVTVYLTRTDDRSLSLEERVEFAKSVSADLLVSVHYNASEFHRFYGTEIFTSAFGNNYSYGKSVAQYIMSAWVEDGAVSKGIKTRIGESGQDYYGLIRHGVEASIPTIIIEHGYIDNSKDWDRIGNEEAFKHLGVLDADAIADFYGLKKSVVQQKINPDISVAMPEGVMVPDTTAPEKVDLSIDRYNPDTGMVEYTIYAKDSESNLMYYCMDLKDNTEDENSCFMDLKLWDSSDNYLQGTYKVPKNYKGEVLVRVYNNYELFTDSKTVEISKDMPEASSDDILAEDEAIANSQADDKGNLTPSEKILDEIEKMRDEIENGGEDSLKTGDGASLTDKEDINSGENNKGENAVENLADGEKSDSLKEKIENDDNEEMKQVIDEIENKYANREKRQQALVGLLMGAVVLVLATLIAYIIFTVVNKRK